LEKDYLPQRRKDAKFGVLFKGILSDENLLLCALAPWREINLNPGKKISRKERGSRELTTLSHKVEGQRPPKKNVIIRLF
jgi:hypothetical protein